jgi:hypothetical protein
MWCDDAQHCHTMPTKVGIHVFATHTGKDVDGRHKAGHDGEGASRSYA